MFRKILIFVIVVLFASNCFFISAQPDVSAKSAVLIEQKSGKVLFVKDADERRPMASTTKIMTALTVLRNEKNLDRKVKIPLQAIKTEGSSMYLQEGEEMTIRDLLYGMLLVSGNDAANALAITVGGSMDKFLNEMNEEAARLKLKNSAFLNPSGLPDDNHYTTANELAVITMEAFKYPLFAEIVASVNARVSYNGIQNARLLVNHNRLLKMYEGCDGVKTGFTKEAGRCLVSSATKNGVRLIAVTLNAPNDWSDHKEMLKFGFAGVKQVTAEKAYEEKIFIPVMGGEQNGVILTNSSDASAVSIDGNEKFEKKILMPQFIYAPVKKGQAIGKIIFLSDGYEMGETDLVATEDIKVLPPENFAKRFNRLIENIVKIIF